jgi:tetratricopeptide (TPR) repeat protein
VLRRGRLIALLVLGVAGPACAPRVAPPIPEGEDFVRPEAEEGLSPKDARALEEAWTRVLSGDTERAARDYQRLLRRHPALLPAQAGLGYARLRAGDAAAASAAFATALESHPDSVSALVGAGSAAFRAGRGDEALRLYRRALGVAPTDPLVRRRVGELKLHMAERHLSAAQTARDAGDLATAASEYEDALGAAPELASVRLELAEMLVGRADVAGAVDVLRADPSHDRSVSLRLGALLLAGERYDEALSVYQDLLARDPADAEARRGRRTARAGLDFQAQPEEYRRIESAARVSRADLAALLAVKVSALSRLPPRRSPVAVDISASWARDHITTILGLGIMDVYPNHTFQPGARMRRGEVAQAVARVLDLLRAPETPAPLPLDVAPSHLDRDAMVRVVGAGIMPLGPDGAFEPWRTVTGREAVEIVEALARVVGP